MLKRLLYVPLSLLKRLADAGLRQELDRLQTELKEAKVTIRVQEAEIEAWTAVSVRNLKRVEAETAIEVQRTAQAEAGGGR